MQKLNRDWGINDFCSQLSSVFRLAGYMIVQLSSPALVIASLKIVQLSAQRDFSNADSVAYGVRNEKWVTSMESWFLQASIGVSYVSIGGVV